MSSFFSTLRHRISPLLLLRHNVPSPLHFTTTTSFSVRQNPKTHLSRKTPPSKNLLKARKLSHKNLSSLSLSPLLSPTPTPSPDHAIGKVTSQQANFMRVTLSKEDGGVELLCVVKGVLKKIKRRVLVGDKVVVGAIDWVAMRGQIENVFQRSFDISHPPVANVDHLLVVFSLEQPKVEGFTLTRFLVEAESTGIPVTLALNKAELVDEETQLAWETKLRAWGYKPLFCSVESGHGLDSLKFILREQTSVIVGPSGVGKSSLINALRSNKDQRVGEVSMRSGRGKHTTRNVSLLPLTGGGYLADTPGFNLPSLLKVTKKSLAQMFPEVREMLSGREPAKCSFNNCLHVGEPGCAVKGDWERYPYYLRLLDEIKIREEFQLRTLGTKRESDVRYKVGDKGVKQAEPRLELKKHRRQSRKRINQSRIDGLEELDELDELDDYESLTGIGESPSEVSTR